MHRVILALALAGAVACTDGGSVGPEPGGPGTIRVLLTDAPFPFDQVQSVNVHIVSIEAATTFDTTQVVDWTLLAAPDQRFDLLELQDGRTALLGETNGDGADFAAVRLVLRTDLSGITLADGSPATVDWMGPAVQTIHTGIEQPLSLTSGPTDADLVIDFDVGRSFAVVPQASGSTIAFRFLPWIRAVNEAATGTITGTVSDLGDGQLVPLPHANVTLYRGTNPLIAMASGRADAEGRFAIHYVSGGGPYMVEAAPPAGVPGSYGYTRDVYVTPGASTVADVVLGTGVNGGASRLEISGPATVAVGQTITLFAFAFNEHGDSIFGTGVTWQHSNAGVAQLTGGGASVQLTGLASGTTAVVATLGDLADSLVVGVGDPGADVATVELSPAAAALAVGDSAGFQAILRDAAGNRIADRAVSWSIDGDALTVLGSWGDYVIVRAVAVGTAIIRATVDGVEGSASVTVS